MEIFNLLSDLINPSVIYVATFKWASLLLPVTGFLLIMGCYVRVMETQLSQGGGLGQWGLTLRSIAAWTMVLTVYVSVAGLIVWFINDIIEYMNRFGSVQALMLEMRSLDKVIVKKMNNQNETFSFFSIEAWSNITSSAASLIPALILDAFYSGSTMLLISIAGFLRLCHAILFSVLYVMGLIIIPLSISRSLDIRGSWLMGVYFIFVWPMVDSLMIGLFTFSARQALERYVGESTHAALTDGMNALLVFNVLNIISCFLLIASVGVSLYLVSKSNNNSGMTSPIFIVTKKFFGSLKRR